MEIQEKGDRIEVPNMSWFLLWARMHAPIFLFVLIWTHHSKFTPENQTSWKMMIHSFPFFWSKNSLFSEAKWLLVSGSVVVKYSHQPMDVQLHFPQLTA